MVLFYFFVLPEESNERDGLNGLAKTHLIGQYAVDSSLVQTDHPVEPIQLVIPQCPLGGQHRGLFVKPSQH